MLKVSAVPTFLRAVKKLHANQKVALDDAVKEIAAQPGAGEEKRGDLSGVFVHKFKMNGLEYLLAYELLPNKQAPEEVMLLALGAHENFYRNLKGR
jgi:mRNA-degrading endonuclease RelE of RelBE toxin-antitoxin system